MDDHPLLHAQASRGAEIGLWRGRTRALRYGPADYEALVSGHAVLDLLDRSALIVRGDDRETWLQGMVTADLRSLGEGSGRPACFLEPKGHLLGDAWIARLPEALLVEVPAACSDAIAAHCDRHLVMEDAEVEQARDTIVFLHVLGAQIEEIAGMRECALCVVSRPWCGRPGWWLAVPTQKAAQVWGSLVESGLAPVGAEAAETARVEHGTPEYGTDMDTSTLPPEAGLHLSHISYEKGCYVGQEVMARLHARGHTNRQLAGLILSGQGPAAAGERVMSSDGAADIGWTTSSVWSPRLTAWIALAYVRHEFRAPGTTVLISGQRDATVSVLPFVPADRR